MPVPRSQLDILTEALVVTFLIVADQTAAALASGSLADDFADRVAARIRGAATGEAGSNSPFLNQRQAAVYTGRSVSSLRRARQLGLSFAVVGGLVVFERAVLDAWMRGENPVGAERARLDGAATPDGQPLERGPPVTGERQIDRQAHRFDAFHTR